MSTQLDIFRAKLQLFDHRETLELLLAKFPTCEKGIAYTKDCIAKFELIIPA